MANIIATVNMLEEGIRRENDEKRINDLKIRRDLLIDVLTELRVDYGSKNKDQDRVA